MPAGLDEAAAIAGILSLSITLFNGCVQGFDILVTARNIGADGDLLQCMLEWEEYRLFEWASAAGLLEKDAAASSPTFNWALINSLLMQLQQLLQDTQGLKHRYHLELLDDGPSTEVSVEKDRRSGLGSVAVKLRPQFYTTRARIIHSANNPVKRLRWAILDKSNFEALIGQIRHFVGCLHDALEFADRRTIKSTLDSLLRSAVARNHDGAQLQLFEDFASTSLEDASVAIAASTKRRYLPPTVVGGQSSSISVKTPTRATKVKALRLKPALFKYTPGPSSAENRECATYKNAAVLVEWKHLSEDLRRLEFRVHDIAILLSELDTSFRSLPCSGFVEDQENSRYGYVFSLQGPAQQQAEGDACIVVTLLDLIKDDAVERPSLDVRRRLGVTMAEAVLQLHTADLLHKDIRSANVLFLNHQKSWSLNHRGPYLMGYGFSRNASPTEISEGMPSNLDQDAYRHPATLSSQRPFYRKQFDLYALGLLLLQIGLWKEMERFLDHDTVMEAKASKSIRPILQHLGTGRDSALSDLSFCGGAAFAEAVRLCINPEAEDVNDDSDDGADDSIHVQEKIVAKLKSISLN